MQQKNKSLEERTIFPISGCIKAATVLGIGNSYIGWTLFDYGGAVIGGVTGVLLGAYSEYYRANHLFNQNDKNKIDGVG